MAKTRSFEESVKELENIIAILEKGECPLDEAVELFEKGVKLSKECHKTLENAEQKIKVLTEDKSPEELKEE